MYPNTGDPTAAIGGALAAGGLVIIVVYLVFMFFVVSIGYLIMKAAVRNGVMEALKKTGYTDQTGWRVSAPVPAYSTPVPASYHPYGQQGS